MGKNSDESVEIYLKEMHAPNLNMTIQMTIRDRPNCSIACMYRLRKKMQFYNDIVEGYCRTPTNPLK